jgi:ParB family chromosome partitioning protein
LLVKRKEIKRTEPIRCVIDTANDAFEISLDENVARENMHPADQFEAFKKLAEERGFAAFHRTFDSPAAGLFAGSAASY